MSSLAQINVKFTADLRGFSTESQKAMRIIGKIGDDMQKLGRSMSLYVTAPLLAGAAASIKFASDYNESLNKVDVAFGRSSAQVKQFGKTALETYGISEGAALDMAALFGDMATSLGLPQAKAADMSKSLVGLAGDLASFKNIGIDEATTALNGIFTGETESLKRLGVVMTQANLQQFAYSEGIKVNIKDLTQAQQVQLRYAYVMAQTKNAQGDFARTGGGAANQMRIFQESLKQVAAQFGQVILPAFTRGISAVNEIIKSFSGLSDQTKTTILVIGGFAAAIGPILTGMGSLLTLIPNVITKFNALRDNLIALQALIVANPFTAIAIGLAAVAAISIASISRFTELTSATKELADINIKAAESVAQETAELNKNVAIAKNKDLSDAKRIEAIEALNAISPEMLGNLTLENIYTNESTAAINKYSDAMLKKARVQAAEEKMVEIQKKLLDLQLGNLNAVKPSVWQNLGNAVLSYGNSAQFAALSGQTMVKNFGAEYAELLKLLNLLTTFVAKNGEIVSSNAGVTNSLKDLVSMANSLKPGSVAFYESQIEALRKLQNEAAVTRVEWRSYEIQIEAIQDKIDRLNGTKIDIQKPELPDLDAEGFDGLVVPRTVDVIEAEIAHFSQLRDAYSTTLEEYQRFQRGINNLEFEKKSITLDIEGLKLNAEKAKKIFTELEIRYKEFGEKTSEMVQNLKVDLAVGLGEAVGALFIGATSIGGAIQKFMGIIGAFMKTLGKSLIELGIAKLAATSLGNALGGPGAIAAGIALVALGSIVQTKFAEGPAFANGGVVPGNSYYGDKIYARLNSGELILNGPQQNKLWGIMNSGGGSSDGPMRIEHVIKGSDIHLILRRFEEQKNRLG